MNPPCGAHILGGIERRAPKREVTLRWSIAPRDASTMGAPQEYLTQGLVSSEIALTRAKVNCASRQEKWLPND